MTPTPHLRWVERHHYVPIYRVEKVLQVLWRAHHIPAGQTQAPEEWRDVPTVREEMK